MPLSQQTTDKLLEFLRLLLLTLAALHIYRPFLFNGIMGEGDAYWYHAIAFDVIQQNLQGIFPVYIGQSLLNFTGNPMGRAPYYLLLVSLLNELTFHQLSSLTIHHCTVIVSALAGAYIMYFALTKLAPNLRWTAVAFTLFYLSCPGILGIIYTLDMYFSFMTFPFVALLIYALIRNYQCSDRISYLLLAMALSLLWMAHPPIALWSTAVAALFCLFRIATQPKTIIGFSLSALLFFVLSLWFFTTIISLDLGGGYAPSNKESLLGAIMEYLQKSIPDIFLPIHFKKIDDLGYLQLGYALWSAVLMGIAIAIRPHHQLVRYLLACVLFLLLFLYPIPYVTYTLWSYLPEVVFNITLTWPMQRFYIILAALACFIGFLSLRDIYPNSRKWVNYLITAVLIFAIGWNLYQTQLFIKKIRLTRSQSQAWLLPENARLYGEYTMPSLQPSHQLWQQLYDPAFMLRLLDKNLNNIASFDNRQIISRRCTASRKQDDQSAAVTQQKHFPLQIYPKPDQFLTWPLMNLRITPNKKYLLCIDMSLFNTSGIFTVFSENHRTISLFDSTRQVGEHSIMLIPIFTEQKEPKELSVMISAGYANAQTKLQLHSFKLISYDTNTLPIKLKSLIPYRVEVNNPFKAAYIETIRQFIPGYIALVNGKKSEILKTPTGRIMVPLVPGKNDIVLLYRGTLAMKLTFYLSALAWCAAIIALIAHTLRRKKHEP